MQQNAQQPPVSSPFSEKNLARVVISDIAGIKPLASMTREDAMSVPSVAKARALILGTLGRQPLALFEGDTMLDPPVWTYRSDTIQSPLQRMCWTLDDLLFYGRSLWYVERDNSKQIVDAIRVPQDWWEIDQSGIVYGRIDGEKSKEPLPNESIIYFEGLQEGLLDIAARTLRGAIDLEKAWSDRIKAPIPLVELHEAERDTEVNDEEAAEYIIKWENARRNSGTAFTPYGLEMRTHGDKSTDLFVEGRNALRLDVALFTSIPSTLLEGSQATASLTYSTQEGRRNEMIDYSLSFWAAAIESRLSMDDVCDKGKRIGFNIEYFTQSSQPANYPASKD